MSQELAFYLKTYLNVSENELDACSSLFKLENVKKNDFLLHTGQYAKKLSFIQDGFIRLYVNENGKEVTQWISTKGYFVTDLSSFIFNNPARWNIQALTDIEIFSINKADYEKLTSILPHWQQTEKAFLAHCFTILENRVFSLLSQTAEERYQQLFLQNKALFNQVPLQYLASMLGMTPETFSRIRKKLA